MTGEISYDLVMGDDMSFVEGTYRIGGDWRVFIFSKSDTSIVEWRPCTWDSGVSGVVVEVPRETSLNMPGVERRLSEILGVEAWKRVSGPDSMRLR